MQPGSAPDADAARLALVQPLVEQLAAGQSEALYGLHAAAAALRRRADALELAAESVVQAMTSSLDDALLRIEQAGVILAQDAAAAAHAVTLAGEDLIGRLIGVLDERDKRDKLLEDRISARVDRLTKKTETTITRLIGELADEADLVRTRDEQGRVAAAQQIENVLTQLLSLPRGKLKELREAAQTPKDPS